MPIKKQVAKSVKKLVAKPAKAAPVEKKLTGRVSFGCAVSSFFKKYFQFSGTATRAEFWWVFLFEILCVFALVLISSFVVAWTVQPVDPGAELPQNVKFAVLLPVVLFYIATIVPWYALMARRLHDVGITAKLLWVNVVFGLYPVLLPGVVRGFAVMNWLDLMWTFVLFILFLFPSKTKNNPYSK